MGLTVPLISRFQGHLNESGSKADNVSVYGTLLSSVEIRVNGYKLWYTVYRSKLYIIHSVLVRHKIKKK